ncbi:MAG: sulfate transporter CysZ [endosymbiont of Galathealinum brachiosum]|uniref:Sulfate transporter CysZ n=1 Tax=endosymbiont of Galathealinum brachiosum TaxID=2200906 RepID=A0A370DIP5_9GAMM|nr:MAG: sulfate transporter CysZ [endosymbiont of Galathealinum brachiosum]
MIGNLFKGFGHIFEGLKLITQPGLRRFVLIPLSINITLFGGATWYLFIKFDEWMNSLLPDFPDWLSWLETALIWLLWPLFSIMILLVIFYTFTFIANLIAAPFNSLLAEKVEKHLTGQPLDTGPSFPTSEMIKRSIASEIGKLFYFIKWWIVLFILTLIPVINLAAPFIWILFGAWMLSLEYLDYPMSNHNKFFKDINKQAISKRSLSLGFGGSVMLFTSIPVLNFIAMPAGVAGATSLWVKYGDQLS